MDSLLKIPVFPLLWFMDYLPGVFRFVVAALVLFKMMRDVYKYNHDKPEGVLRNRVEENENFNTPQHRHPHNPYYNQYEYSPTTEFHRIS